MLVLDEALTLNLYLFTVVREALQLKIASENYRAQQFKQS